MSIKIRCAEPLCNRETPNSFTLDASEIHAKLGEVFIRLNGDRSLPGHYVSRAAFLAAVAAECDAIVIERAELPEVTEDGEVDGTSGKVARFQCDGTSGFADSPPWRHRQIGISHLALAEYLDAHPPVPPVSDEDVEELARIIRPISGRMFASDIARRLLRTGRVSVTHE